MAQEEDIIKYGLSRAEFQVCTVEQAVKLNHLGVLQSAMFYWLYYTNSYKKSLHIYKAANKIYGFALKKFGDKSVVEMVCAFTAAELLVMIGSPIKIERPNTAAQDLGEYLIQQIEESKITVDEVNERIGNNNLALE
jgi:hypothetical protein